MNTRKQSPRRPSQVTELHRLADALIGKPMTANDRLPTREEQSHMDKTDMRETLEPATAKRPS